MSEIIDQKLGESGDVKLELVGAELKLTVIEKVGDLDASASISLPPRVLLDKLKALIPGKIDDAIIDALEAALLPAAPAAPVA